MLCVGMQNRSEFPMVFEQMDAMAGNPINRRTCSKEPIANRQVVRLKQPPDPPVEAVSRAFESAESHQAEQLIVGYKSRISDLPEQRNVSRCLNHQAVFCISHSGLLNSFCEQIKRGGVAHATSGYLPMSKHCSHPVSRFHEQQGFALLMELADGYRDDRF